MANRPVAHYSMAGSKRNDCEVLLVPLCRGARWSGPGLGPLQIYSGQGMGPGRLKQTKTQKREKGSEGKAEVDLFIFWQKVVNDHVPWEWTELMTITENSG